MQEKETKYTGILILELCSGNSNPLRREGRLLLDAKKFSYSSCCP